MEYLRVVFSSLFSLVLLFFLTKLTGKRQMSQLSVFDYVNSITIGSIAAEMATELEKNILLPSIAIVIYSLSVFLLSKLAQHSIKARSFVDGKSAIIFDNSEFDLKELKKSQFDITEVFAECRSQGYFDFSDIQTIVAEHNGKMSVLPKSTKRPVITEDLNLCPKQDRTYEIVISEGRIITENLIKNGKNHDWLKKQLKQQKTDIHDVFLATCTNDNQLNIFKDKYSQKFNK
ncbi:MAG: DUF421 domain-containing protein [Oscillospiraceae bacterium]|nr:DUF421 domain-containing protein [Oscillospiraceae bacterium]